MNKHDKARQVIELADYLGITKQLAKELLILAGGDDELVIKSSSEANNISHCKALITDGRLSKLEDNK